MVIVPALSLKKHIFAKNSLFVSIIIEQLFMKKISCAKQKKLYGKTKKKRKNK